jgi:hypothetical protein
MRTVRVVSALALLVAACGQAGEPGAPVTPDLVAELIAKDPGGDVDKDGLTNLEEVKTYHTDPFKADTDGDGLADGTEVKLYCSNPLDGDSRVVAYNSSGEVEMARAGDGVLDGQDPDLRADINRDGNIDGIDMLSIASAFNSRPDSPHWYEPADLNRDQVVNQADMDILDLRFGLWFCGAAP